MGEGPWSWAGRTSSVESDLLKPSDKDFQAFKTKSLELEASSLGMNRYLGAVRGTCRRENLPVVPHGVPFQP